jgi:hypothetical protein
MEGFMDKNTYPLAEALEKAGYSILKFECVMESVYNSERQKSVPSPVIRLEVIPSDGAKMLFIAS